MHIKHGNLWSKVERDKVLKEPAIGLLNFLSTNVVASNVIHLLTLLLCQN